MKHFQSSCIFLFMFISQSFMVFNQSSRLLKSPISGKRDYQNIWVGKPFKMVTSIYDTKVSDKISAREGRLSGREITHYVSMIRNHENGICTRYNDDFITKHRERGALQSLKNNNHGLVHRLVYIKT